MHLEQGGAQEVQADAANRSGEPPVWQRVGREQLTACCTATLTWLPAPPVPHKLPAGLRDSAVTGKGAGDVQGLTEIMCPCAMHACGSMGCVQAASLCPSCHTINWERYDFLDGCQCLLVRRLRW